VINLDKLESFITIDVLVVGGGMAGLCAAIKASESHINVLVVDKGGIGWSGQVPVGSGSLAYIYPDQVERFCQWVTEYNQYLNNQDWTYMLAQGLTRVHNELADLGVPFLKKNGDIAIVTLGKDNYRTKLDAPRAMLKLKALLYPGSKNLG
jgi:succinate dehydrogenase/fumarate reductase flavoprotein subunit